LKILDVGDYFIVHTSTEIKEYIVDPDSIRLIKVFKLVRKK